MSQFLQQLSDNDLLFTMKSIWETLSGSEKLVILHEFFGSLDMNEQIHFFSMLGDLFNKSLNETGLEISHKLKEMSMDELSKKGSKKIIYELCDKRLKALFHSATKNSNQYNKYIHDNSNELYNIFENLLKARNNNFTSPIGLWSTWFHL